MELPPLPRSTILLTEVGSTAHGTGNVGTDDLDLMGMFIEGQDEVLGLQGPPSSTMHRTQPEGVRSGPGDIDRTMHPLRRFLRLALAGNPSILMVLWAPVVTAAPEGIHLRQMSQLFVGRHVIPRYRGYMQGQALRLLGLRSSGHGRRGGGGREELIAAHGYDTKYAMHCARLGFQCRELLETGELKLPMEGHAAHWLRLVRSGQVDFKEWWEVTLGLDAQLDTLARDEGLPPQPDAAQVEAWAIATQLDYWRDSR